MFPVLYVACYQGLSVYCSPGTETLLASSFLCQQLIPEFSSIDSAPPKVGFQNILEMRKGPSQAMLSVL